MIYLQFCDSIDTTSTEEFLNKLNAIEEDAEITLSINSNGGSLSDAELLSKIINDDDRIKKIYFMWEISSSAFSLFLNNTKPFQCLQMFSVLHKAYRNLSTTPNTQDDFLVSDLEKRNKRFIKALKKIGLSKKKIKMLENDEDVYITGEQAMKLKSNYEDEIELFLF